MINLHLYCASCHTLSSWQLTSRLGQLLTLTLHSYIYDDTTLLFFSRILELLTLRET